MTRMIHGAAALLAVALLATTALADEVEAPDPEGSAVRIRAVGGAYAHLTSGVVVEGGDVLTSAHGIGCPKKIEIEPPGGGKATSASVILLDDTLDLALLRPAQPLERTEVAPAPANPQPGDTLYLWGRSSGQRSGPVVEVAPSGIPVAVVSRPGDSGGPALNADGSLAGLLRSLAVERHADTPLSNLVSRDAVTDFLAVERPKKPLRKAVLCHSSRKVWELRASALSAVEDDVYTAIARLGSALNLEPEPGVRVDLLTLRGQLQARTGRSYPATVDFRAALQLDPGHIDAWQGLIGMLLDDRKRERALGVVEEAMIALPDSNWLLLRRVELLGTLSRGKDAVELLDELLLNDPERGDFLGARCKAHLQVRMFRSAMEDCRAALDAGYRHSAVYKDLANLLLLGGDYAGAIDVYTEALERGAQDGAIPYNRGVLRLMTGDWQGAEDDLDLAGKLGWAEDPYTWYCRAVALVHLERLDEAYAALDHALTIAEGWKRAVELKDHLDSGGRVGRVFPSGVVEMLPAESD